MNQIRRTYNRKADAYHLKRKNAREAFWNNCIDLPAIKRLTKDSVRGKKVLDLGCGSGIFTAQLNKWGGRVTGVDFSSTLLEIAKSENPNIPFIVANAKRLPFKKYSYSVVVSALMAHYFRDLTPVFREVARILKPKGVFVFSMHHPVMEVLHFSNRQKRKGNLSWQPYFHSNKYKWKMLDGMVLESYHHTFETIFDSLHRTGFVVERLLEPQPLAKGKKLQPEAYRLAQRCPYFCTIRAVSQA